MFHFISYILLLLVFMCLSAWKVIIRCFISIMAACGVMVFKPGDLIYNNEPFVYVSNPELRNRICDFCFKRCSEVKLCIHCKYVSYCSKSCQLTAWTEHKKECKHMKKLPVEPDILFVMYTRLVGKLVLKLKTEEGRAFSDTVGTYKRSFSDLMSCSKDFSNINRSYEVENVISATLNAALMPTEKQKILGMSVSDVMSGYENFKYEENEKIRMHNIIVCTSDFIGIENMPDKEEMYKIMGKVECNMHHVEDKLYTSGIALYLGASIFDHGCVPNAVKTFNGKSIEIRAIKHMTCTDIRDVNFSYYSLIDSDNSQEDLALKFGHECKCKDCSLPYGDSILSKIRDKEKAGLVIRTSEGVLNMMKNSDISRRTLLLAVDPCLRQQENVLGDTNIYRLKLLTKRVRLTSDPEEAVTYATKLIKHLVVAFGDSSPELIWVYESLSLKYSELGDSKRAMQCRTKFVNLYKLHGREEQLNMYESMSAQFDHMIANMTGPMAVKFMEFMKGAK